MKIQAALACVAFACLLPSCLSAQEGRARKPNFAIDAGRIELTDLIDRCAVYLQWNILSDEQEMQQARPITLQIPVSTDTDGCEELLCSLLQRGGYALTALDASKDIYEVIWMQGARVREVLSRAQQRSAAEVLARPRLKLPITSVVQLEHINGMIATNALRPFFASFHGQQMGLVIGNVGSTKSIVLSGFQDQVAEAIRLIQACDVEQLPEPYQGQPLPEYVSKLEARLQKLEERLQKMTGDAAGKEK